MRRRRHRAALTVALLLLSAPTIALQAQDDRIRITRPGAAPPQPSDAERFLAQGRLAAAEAALYADVEANPRAPEPRGALGLYLASRARFRIAEVLFEEAQRFGADPVRVRRALAQLAPYRAAVAAGPAVTLTLRPSIEANVLGEIDATLGRSSETLVAIVDPNVHGLVLGRRLAETAGLRGRNAAAPAIELGGRRIQPATVTVDSLASPTQMRVGLDVLWGLHPQVDAAAGTLSLGRTPPAQLSATQRRIPFVLTFPGMLLVPQVGQAPVALGSREARLLLANRPWQLDAATSTIIVGR